ncbi:hypothetical protein [Pusillimonas sp. ANT_WB101]|uniref:hypothetical protein n=1 Tax=Pusillimonas sp. ANT_WB101 TaxID=2597356 RepID=UPI0011EC36C6|nr:hypothetical protein [Pusillimonas sp. ANT_WB101]KAA0911384.1 hypothetical protein FQ179_06000 [Pusillimonas sp. ANT_WB101]
MEYVREFHGCRTHFRFPVVHLRHWFKLWDYLEKSAQENSFTMVVMAQLLAEKHRKGAPRVDAKIRLFRFLSQLSYAPHDMQQLARIIDWFLVLPAHFQEIFYQEIQSLKKDLNMTFITSFERNGIKQGMQLGLQKGREEGRREGVHDMLRAQIKIKFEMLPEWADMKIKKADAGDLERWICNVVTAQRVEDVFL